MKKSDTLKKFLGKWAKQSLIAIDQAVNAFVFFGMADETISARCWRNKDNSWYWALLRISIDILFFVFERNHCQKAYESEIQKRQLPDQYMRDFISRVEEFAPSIVEKNAQGNKL